MKPILFNTTMVHAILNGRKTVTRRDPFHFSMKPGYSPDWSGYSLGEYYTGHIETGVCLYSRGAHDVWGVCSNVVKPRYQVGDVLWVRETWQECCRNHVHSPTIHSQYCYRASLDSALYGCIEECGRICKWRPSIHMPKEAARIFLKVSDVRVERLQDIIANEIEKEGMAPSNVDKSDDFYNGIAREVFARLWNSTVKEKDITDFGWDANPWVFVVEFERITESEAKNE